MTLHEDVVQEKLKSMSLLGTINLFSFFLLIGASAFSLTFKTQLYVQGGVLALFIWAWPRLSKIRTTLVVQGVFLCLVLVGSPVINNSETASGLVALLILVLLWPVVRRPSFSAGHRFYKNLQNTMMVGFGLLYGWAVLHKLNHHFLNPYTTCATDILQRFSSEVFGERLQQSSFVGVVLIALTFVIEFGLPLIILSRPRFRVVGLCLLWGFHLLLSPSYFGFLPTVLIFSIPFLDGVTRRRFLDRFRLAPTWALMAAAAFIVFARYYPWVGLTGLTSMLPKSTGSLLQLGLAVLILGVLAWPRFGARVQSIQVKAIQWWWVGLFVFNGLTPYLGIKTIGAWAMYSNLRTEGYNNHLFLPSVDLFHQRDDLVTIPLEAQRWLSHDRSFYLNRSGDIQLPRLEVGRRMIQDNGRMSQGLRNTLEQSMGRDEVNSIMQNYADSPWWYKKFFAYRPVSIFPGACMW